MRLRGCVGRVGGAIGLALVASCGSSTSPSGGTGGGGGGGVTCTSTPTKVCMVGMAFSPATLTVPAGTTVQWQNGSSYTHSVTSDPASPLAYDSNDVGNGGTYSQTFATAGTYHYYCKYHISLGMTGTITVQ